MARRFATNIDLLGFSLLNAMLNPTSSDPSDLVSGNAGRVWFNSSVPTLKFWDGSNTIDLLNRATHTGFQPASTINDFTSAVEALQWAAMTAPTAAVNMNSENFTGLATATTSGQAVEFAQFNNAIAAVKSGLDFKEPPATVVTTTNVSLTAPGATINGHTMVSGDSVLLTGQTTPSQNGLYSWQSSTLLTRRADANSAGSITSGTMVAVTGQDNTNPHTVWMQTSVGTGANGSITLDTDSQSWIMPFSTTTYSGSATIDVNAGTGVISAILASGGGLVGDTGLAVDTSLVSEKKVSVVPTATSGSWIVSGNVGTFNHGLANFAPEVVIRAYTSPSPYTQGQEVEMDVIATDQNNIQITFPSALSSANNAWIVQVIG